VGEGQGEGRNQKEKYIHPNESAVGNQKNRYDILCREKSLHGQLV
jgi:hypothetical protein